MTIEVPEVNPNLVDFEVGQWHITGGEFFLDPDVVFYEDYARSLLYGIAHIVDFRDERLLCYVTGDPEIEVGRIASSFEVSFPQSISTFEKECVLQIAERENAVQYPTKNIVPLDVGCVNRKLFGFGFDFVGTDHLVILSFLNQQSIEDRGHLCSDQPQASSRTLPLGV